MHFAHQHQAHGSQASKFALVAGLHVLVAFGIINMTNSKIFTAPKPSGPVILVPTEPLEPVVPPIDPPTPPKQIAPPDVVIPKVEIEVQQQQIENPVHAVLETEAKPQPTGPVQPEGKPDVPAKPAANNGTMRSAVLADAKSCVTPNYPAQAARNGESGTVVLALLVGTNGRVTDSRVTKTSGSRDLDRAAVNALSLCQFKPAMTNGVAEAAWAQIAYDWKLD